MTGTAVALFVKALFAAMLLSLPAIGLVAAIGIVVGLVQTIFQIQDQNVSFFPKLVAIAALAVAAGPLAIEVLRTLLVAVVAALPRLAAG